MKKRRAVTLLTMAAVVFSMIFVVPVKQVAAKDKYEVPSKVKVYFNEYNEKPDWEFTVEHNYKYNKYGYVTSIFDNKINWTIKSGKATKAGTRDGYNAATYKYNKGKLSSISYKIYDENGKYSGKATEKYTYKKGWIAKVSGKNGKRTYKVTYTYDFYKDGATPRTITEKKIVSGDTLKTTYYFNKKGLLTKAKSGGLSWNFKYKYDSKGRVSQVIQSAGDMAMYKFKFKYDGTKAKDKKAYMAVFNWFEPVGAFRDTVPIAPPLW